MSNERQGTTVSAEGVVKADPAQQASGLPMGSAQAPVWGEWVQAGPVCPRFPRGQPRLDWPAPVPAEQCARAWWESQVPERAVGKTRRKQITVFWTWDVSWSQILTLQPSTHERLTGVYRSLCVCRGVQGAPD